MCKFKVLKHDEGKVLNYKLLQRAGGGCKSANWVFDSVLEWPMMNCDGFRPILRTKVGR
ncbi:MAG: hypothetical protein ACOX3R_05635 [Desulfitobacteriia bacterium]